MWRDDNLIVAKKLQCISAEEHLANKISESRAQMTVDVKTQAAE